MDRKQFLTTGVLTTGLYIAAPHVIFSKEQEKPQLDKKIVQNFVGAGHKSLETVKELLAEHPTLINAAHDWRGGDFETCLGAASHVGYKELAQYLLDHGAQANVFTAALFGKIDIIKSILEFSPGTLHAKGPHGYTLLHHAERGGEESKEITEYLKSLGLKKTKIDLF
ncbi:hypothetical protein IWQ47_000678 [Aquimarina sp. EL_43]|uniref:ankyrin repeat domain-containing protein n=1 Tax=unclassified Aquimarina TaxID=2627091 RepID=UPI000D6E34B8|nr:MULTISPECIES: ankyrin repeat domain-containing protein [unclassified Aquimarina]MBG6128632.1 hypothetical protein [Aquimarina sp. EL_35]MBG6149695.1 hypothetical protein [Aquimarina sp. EL_32]MBG6167620.1 hypothetical protein [Aquimarina sp. EL_43]